MSGLDAINGSTGVTGISTGCSIGAIGNVDFTGDTNSNDRAPLGGSGDTGVIGST
jgi:hypothetical protein